MKKQTLLILNTPPPYGGGEIQAQLVSDYFRNLTGYTIYSYSRDNSSKKTQGKISVSNIVFGIQLICSILSMIVIKRPRKIFISLPKEFFGFLRTSVLILFCNTLGIKVYCEVAGAFLSFMEKENSYKFYLGKYVLKRIHSIRLLGPSIKKKFDEIGINNTVYFSNGVHKPKGLQIKNNVIHNNVMNLLYVGALNYSKGIDKIILAINECLENNIAIKMHCIGEWSDEKEKIKIVELIDEYGIKQHVSFHGLLLDDMKWKIFSRCGILLHPTNWDGQPLTILEAMGLGLCIISTKVGAIADTVIHGRNGIILEKNNHRCLADAIKIFCNNRNYLAAVSQNNIEDFSRKFTKEIFLKKNQCWLEDKNINIY